MLIKNLLRDVNEYTVGLNVDLALFYEPAELKVKMS